MLGHQSNFRTLRPNSDSGQLAEAELARISQWDFRTPKASRSIISKFNLRADGDDRCMTLTITTASAAMHSQLIPSMDEYT